MATYAEKLKDPRWQKKRLEIMQRDGFKCQHCMSHERTLHVHHMYYEKGRNPWDYPEEALITFCLDCHEAMGNAQIDLAKAIAHLGLSSFEIGMLADAMAEGAITRTMSGPALAEFFRNPFFQDDVVSMFEDLFYNRHPELRDD